jgi:nitroreductase
MDDIRSVMLERRTVHDYLDAPLPQGAVERAIEVALAAPNHRMTEPWRFYRVGPRTRGQLCEISIELKSGGAQPRDDLVATTRRKMLNPAELLVVSRIRSEDPRVEREDYAAIACAIQNLSLSLWSEGIGSKWSTGGVTRAEATYAALNIDAHVEEIVGFIWVGMAAKQKPKVPRRLSADDVVRRLP